MKVREKIECKFLIGKAGALRLTPCSGTLRRTGVMKTVTFETTIDVNFILKIMSI